MYKQSGQDRRAQPKTAVMKDADLECDALRNNAKNNKAPISATGNVYLLAGKYNRRASLACCQNYDGVSGSHGRSELSDFQQTKNGQAVSMHENSPQRTTAAPSEGKVDQALVERVKRGDMRAFDMLVMKYQGKVASIVGRYVSDYHEVHDVTQEAFIKAYRALKNFRGDSAFYTWLYRIAINSAKNYLVARKRRPPGVDVDVEDAEFYGSDTGLKDISSPEKKLFRDELENIVNEAIRILPDDLKTALTLREFDGLSYEEISDIMQCPIGTVRSRIFRAREAIDQKVVAYTGGQSRSGEESGA